MGDLVGTFLTIADETPLMAADPRQEAVLVKEDSIGVSTETKTRKVQMNGSESCEVTINADWLKQLNLHSQGSQTVHSLSLGRKPVIVQNPAIIIQPASVIGEGEE